MVEVYRYDLHKGKVVVKAETQAEAYKKVNELIEKYPDEIVWCVEETENGLPVIKIK